MMLPAFKSKKGFTFLRSKKAKPVLKSFLPSAKSSTGFTLIELLIVIAIISILISIGMASFSRAQKQARDGERKSDIESIRGALEQYYSDNNEYPSDASWVANLENSSGSVYIRDVPEKDPQGNSYFYTTTSPTWSTQKYCISTTLETGSETSLCGGNYSRTAQD